MITLFLIVLLYIICAFANAIYAACIDATYGINTSVNLVCFLGFIGTFVLFVTHCMVRDDIWIHPDRRSIFQRIYESIKEDD